MLSAGAGEAPEPFITAPLWLRLAAATALLWWGRERRWTVIVAAFLALPSIGGVGVAMLVGLLCHLDKRSEATSLDRRRGRRF